MGLLDRISKRAADNVLADLNKVQKANSSALITPGGQSPTVRYAFDPVYINSNYYNKKKPDSIISFDVLRNFSLKYEIVRACINLRKRQLSIADWDIVTAETSDTNDYTSDILKAKEFFVNLGGQVNPETGEITNGSFMRFMNMSVEDIMCLDALSYFKMYDRGGELLTLIPIDGATVRLMVSNDGSPPDPPEIAYKQVIRGTVVQEYTTDELDYSMMNPRTNSPYGLSPLESLMITVSAALKSGLYNLSYLTDGNIPEGLINAPAGWTPTMIREFEANWNAMMAGDAGMTSKLHMLPPDAKYEATKKPTDMAFEQMNEWLMRLTCAVFEVDPIDIGFQPKGKGLGDMGSNAQANKTSDDKGLRPLAQLFEEIFSRVVQDALGLPHLKFAFIGLDAEDTAAVATTNQTMVNAGLRSFNEIRTDEGLEPFEGGDARFFVAGATAVPLNQVAIDLMGSTGTADPPDPNEKPKGGGGSAGAEAEVKGEEADTKKKPSFDDADSNADNDPDITASAKTDKAFVELVTDLRKLRKAMKTNFERKRSFRPFESNALPQSALREINTRLAKASNFEEADEIIKEYRQDYQVNFMHRVNKLREELGVVL